MDQFDETSTTSEYLDSPENEKDNIEFIKVDNMEDSDLEDIFVQENCLPMEGYLGNTRSIKEESTGQQNVLKCRKSLYLKEEVVLTLINTVRRTPILWRQNEPGYRDLSAQQQAWNSVAQQFGVPVENLKEKWKMLRTQFRSNLSKMRNRRAMNGPENDSDYQPKWFAFEAMKFLRDVPDETPSKKASKNKNTATSTTEDGSGSAEDHDDDLPDDTDAYEVILNFINHVKENPVLWDKAHPNYKSLAAQCQAWKTLEDRLQLPIADMKRKWQLLRVQFRNNLRKVKNLSSPDNVYEPTWFAFEAMQFIRKNYRKGTEEEPAAPELSVKLPTKQTDIPKPSVPERTPTIKTIFRECKRPHPSPVHIPNKVQRTNVCASSTTTTTTPSSLSAKPSPASIRPTSYVTSGKVEPFIIRTFRNLSKITDQLAQRKTSPYSGLLDHLAMVLERKRDRDFQEIEGVLLNCLSELQKFPNARKEAVTNDSEIKREEG